MFNALKSSRSILPQPGGGGRRLASLNTNANHYFQWQIMTTQTTLGPGHMRNWGRIDLRPIGALPAPRRHDDARTDAAKLSSLRFEGDYQSRGTPG